MGDEEAGTAGLVLRARDGDATAAKELLAKYRPLVALLVRRYRRQLVGGVNGEDDLWQEGFRHFFELLRGYRGDSAGFGTYLKQMLGWRIANYVRAERRRQQLSERLLPEHMDLLIDELPDATTALVNPRLRSATKSLSPRQRGILYGLYWEGRAVGEIAKAMELTPQRISNLRKRAENRLRKGMHQDEQGNQEIEMVDDLD